MTAATALEAVTTSDGGEVTHGFAEMALEREGPDVQRLLGMELAG